MLIAEPGGNTSFENTEPSGRSAANHCCDAGRSVADRATDKERRKQFGSVLRHEHAAWPIRSRVTYAALTPSTSAARAIEMSEHGSADAASVNERLDPGTTASPIAMTVEATSVEIGTMRSVPVVRTVRRGGATRYRMASTKAPYDATLKWRCLPSVVYR